MRSEVGGAVLEDKLIVLYENVCHSVSMYASFTRILKFGQVHATFKSLMLYCFPMRYYTNG